MFTDEQINEILAPWGASLKERPVPSIDNYAYEPKDRLAARDTAIQWQKDHGNTDIGMDASRDDFICHQADIIYMLAHALSFANRKLLRRSEPSVSIAKGEYIPDSKPRECEIRCPLE